MEVSHPLSMFFIFRSILANHIRNHLKYERSWHLNIFMDGQLSDLSSAYFSQCRRRYRVSVGVEVCHPLSMFFIFRSILANHIRNDLKCAISWHLNIFMGGQLSDLSSAYFSLCLRRHRITAAVKVSDPLSNVRFLAQDIGNYKKCTTPQDLENFLEKQISE